MMRSICILICGLSWLPAELKPEAQAKDFLRIIPSLAIFEVAQFSAPTGAKVISHGRKPVEPELRKGYEALKGRKQITPGIHVDVSPFQGCARGDCRCSKGLRPWLMTLAPAGAKDSATSKLTLRVGMRRDRSALYFFQVNSQAEADPGDGHPGIESGKQALVKKNNFPWYDAAADDLKRIEVQAQKDTTDNQRPWQNNSTPTPPTGTSGFWDVLGEIVRLLIYLVIAAFVTLLIVLLVKAFLKRESRTVTVSGSMSEEEVEGEIARVENLPFQVAPPKGDLLSEAERYYQAGDYNRAIIYLFSYELVKLDQHHAIRLTRGKTNRQYMREVRTRPELANILRNTMLAFEDVFFGHHQLDRQRFEECWQELGEFQRSLGKEVEVPV